MGEPGNNFYDFGDWGASSPSPRTFFSALLGDDISSRAMLENNNMLIPEQKLSGINHEKLSDMHSRQKMNSHGGLSERMAARAGFNAPKLNTEIGQNQDSRSSLLTIPPGLSPTTLLESPVFLSNALAQPSPTTGKFPFFLGGTTDRNFSQVPENPDKNLENFYADFNASSFEFKPVPESGNSAFNDFFGFEDSRATVASTDNSSPPEDSQQDEEVHQPLPGGAPAEDGYNWRKYGQKQVKGSEYPRSYFKCTHPNCPVKKKVERSQEGHVTEIIYKGAHNHPKPVSNRRSGVDLADQSATSSVSVGGGNFQVQNGLWYESGDVVDGPSDVLNDDNEEEDDRATHGSASLGCDGEEDELVSKRRKIEAYAAEMSGATRPIREPKVVVQTTSDVDILDDGYRWRKYGQKVVKGNPNPRSYYKCTHTGCTVRKHVERASQDLKSVITTYEGKHNHEVPAARNSSHLSSANSSNGPSILAHLQRPEPAQSHNGMDRFGKQQFGPDHGFNFGMNQPSLANLAMAELGPVMPGHHYTGGQQQTFDEMGFMLPKREPTAEPLTDDGSSIYQQMMSRMPSGP